jgi:hypothetical protein
MFESSLQTPWETMNNEDILYTISRKGTNIAVMNNEKYWGARWSLLKVGFGKKTMQELIKSAHSTKIAFDQAAQNIELSSIKVYRNRFPFQF